MEKRKSPALPKRPAAGLATGYQPLSGVQDEMMDAAGHVRPGWAPLLAAFDRMGIDEMAARFERADQYLRDAGVFYRKYDGAEGKERNWPLSHVPLIIAEQEWREITAGLIERVEVLERVVADIYGEQSLVERGLLPPELVARNGEFLRPLVGVTPRSGRFLHFVAFEIGRGPDGKWWVLGDRTQAPSGAGFALENRVATTRALGETIAGMNVHRLAGFFRDFRDALVAGAHDTEGRVGILTPGQHNETYFEHAYIARYLGFTLLEGEDLVVDRGRVMVRTVAGLSPVSVLWRRMDAGFVDPLELNQDSRIGTPGLVDAVREGTLTMVNALGSGILESRALAAFMPRIGRELLGHNLRLPGIATWWCGQDAERNHVLSKFDRMMIGPAFSTSLSFDDQRATVIGGTLDAETASILRQRVEEDGESFVGQEPVTLSTTPVFSGDRLVPRPVALRIYAARTEAGWTIMPGGFARVGSAVDTSAIAMQRGGRAADVWVVSPRAVDAVSLLPQKGEKLVRSPVGTLPSRAADNLIWLGRYAERCEATVRVLRAYNARLAEVDNRDSPLLADTRLFLDKLHIDSERPLPAGLLSTIDSAIYSASQIRDRFSPDGWLALNDLSKTARRFAARVEEGDDATRALTVLLRKLAGFSGLVHENMYRFSGWRFLEIGRRLERGIQITGATSWYTRREAPNGSLEMLLEIGDSVMSHRRRYSVSAGPQSAVDLLILDPLNPRSALFQLAAIREQLAELPNAEHEGQLSAASKLALELHTNLVIAEPELLGPKRLTALSGAFAQLATVIGAAFYV